MSGTVKGGKQAAQTIKVKFGDDHYAKIGRKGGAADHPETRPFAVNRELASRAGYKGGIVTGDQYKTRRKIDG